MSAAALAKPTNLFGELFGSNDKKYTRHSSSSNCVRYRRINRPGSVTMKSEGSSLSYQKSDFDKCCNTKLKIRGESVAVFDYKETEEEEQMKERINEEKLNRWIEQSIHEIVKNTGEAPFLMQIFAQGSSPLKLKKEEALPDNWPTMKKRWNESKSNPDGIILVQELKEDEEAVYDQASISNSDNSSRCKKWGLVVQGRGMDCAASCYVLNTCRVKSSAGFCTHFCLVRAKCFGESLDKQLRQTWLHGR